MTSKIQAEVVSLGHGEYFERAWLAYFRLHGSQAAAPSHARSAMVEYDGKRYVILRGEDRVLEVYRIKTDHLLKRMRRYPKALSAFGENDHA